MKLLTPDGTALMQVTAIRIHSGGLLIEGKIMGTMPMKALVSARELRNGVKLLCMRTTLKALAMLIRGR
jgi:hypothetical protein